MQPTNNLSFSYICSVLLHKIRTPHDKQVERYKEQKHAAVMK